MKYEMEFMQRGRSIAKYAGDDPEDALAWFMARSNQGQIAIKGVAKVHDMAPGVCHSLLGRTPMDRDLMAQYRAEKETARKPRRPAPAPRPVPAPVVNHHEPTYELHVPATGEVLTTDDPGEALAWFNARAATSRIRIHYGNRSMVHLLGGPNRLDRRGKTPMDRGFVVRRDRVSVTFLISKADYKMLRSDIVTASEEFRRILGLAKKVKPADVVPFDDGTRHTFSVMLDSDEIAQLKRIGLGKMSVAARFILHIYRNGLL